MFNNLKKKKTVLFLLLCCLMFALLAGCSDTNSNASDKVTDNSQKSSAQQQITEADASVQESIDNAGTESLQASQSALQSEKNVALTSEKMIGKSSQKKVSEDTQIIIKGNGIDEAVTLTLSDINEMGLETYTYSGRNKEQNNARQFIECAGIPLEKLLKAAGWESKDATFRIKCSDGYTGKYKLSEINSLYCFKDADSTEGVVVPAMLMVMEDGVSAVKGKTYSSNDGSPFRLVYGQEDYDANMTKDFNMQGWGFYVEEIELL